MQIVLYQPEIPPNTGNVARLCAATGTPLHLIKPLGFSLEDRYLRRAGLDYWPHVNLTVWNTYDEFLEAGRGARMVYTSARKGTLLFDFPFLEGDCLVFGPETRGCPPELLDAEGADVVRIPIGDRVRSLNMATAAGIVLFEALRQTRYTRSSPS
jgi:tRNA (cytidine/uridine-2'-O-)-methyltransferase